MENNKNEKGRMTKMKKDEYCAKDNVEYDVIGSKFRMLWGSMMIILGIIIGVFTYKYILPIGSIYMIVSGLILIFWKQCRSMIRNIVLRDVKKEIK